jgi:hypothetical protein
MGKMQSVRAAWAAALAWLNSPEGREQIDFEAAVRVAATARLSMARCKAALLGRGAPVDAQACEGALRSLNWKATGSEQSARRWAGQDTLTPALRQHDDHNAGALLAFLKRETGMVENEILAAFLPAAEPTSKAGGACRRALASRGWAGGPWEATLRRWAVSRA